jgi:hypothetical protein
MKYLTINQQPQDMMMERDERIIWFGEDGGRGGGDLRREVERLVIPMSLCWSKAFSISFLPSLLFRSPLPKTNNIQRLFNHNP